MKNIICLLLAFASLTALCAETDLPAPTNSRMAWWRAARFGMFIHYGPVTLTGQEISWSRANSNTNCPNQGKTPVDVYDNLYQEFNPTNFSGADWADIAKKAGMKYVVLTAKHCDGFLLWDSKVDGYNIMATPFKRDLCAELAQAVHQDRLHLGWYFSPMDWRDPDCRSTNNARFVSKMQDELRELLTNYGAVDVLWFDTDGRPAVWGAPTTYPLVRELQPQILINNRLEMSTQSEWLYQGWLRSNEDYYTPEQRIGSYDDQRPWETCMTLGKQWSWKPNDKIKSAGEVIRILARTVGGDGNLLLNVGPMPDGRIEPRQTDVLKQVGAWLAKNGEAIYGTRGGPWKPTASLASTRKGNTIYLHVMKSENSRVELPALPAEIKSVTLLDGEKLAFSQPNGGLAITIPPSAVDPMDTVVKIELDRPAMEISALTTTWIGASALTETNQIVTLPPAGYKLRWSDEFDHDQLDQTKWDYRTDSKMWSTQKPENVSVHDGCLILAVKKEEAGGKHYTGAGVISQQTFKYGYYEARFKVPPGAGWHTSFWIMKHNGQGGTGPTTSAQELDVCENDSVHQDSYSVNVHKWNPQPHVAMGHKTVKTPDLSSNFHVYGCEFTPETVKYYFDGQLVQTVDVSKFQHSEQNIWLTTIASNLGDTKAVDDTKLPEAAEYDYVRFYEKK